MSPDLVVGLMADTIKTTMLVAAPALIIGMLVGLVISLAQAVTQVQEMTLVFVPKIIVVMVTIIVALPWMMNVLLTFTENLYRNVPIYIR